MIVNFFHLHAPAWNSSSDVYHDDAELKDLAANAVLHPIFSLLLDLHPDDDDDEIYDNDFDNDDEHNVDDCDYDDDHDNDDDYDEIDDDNHDNDDEDSDDLQARLEWSPSLGVVR